jgi:hypothetical protein
MNKGLLVFLVAALMFATIASAAPDGEKVVTSSSTVTLCPATSSGPIMVEALANGTATIFLYSSSRLRVWPDTNLGDSDAFFVLRDGIPRPFPTAGDKVDQVVIVLGTATEVILTWTFAN